MFIRHTYYASVHFYDFLMPLKFSYRDENFLIKKYSLIHVFRLRKNAKRYICTFREMSFDLLFRGKCMFDQADKYLSVFNYTDIKSSPSRYFRFTYSCLIKRLNFVWPSGNLLWLNYARLLYCRSKYLFFGIIVEDTNNSYYFHTTNLLPQTTTRNNFPKHHDTRTRKFRIL